MKNYVKALAAFVFVLAAMMLVPVTSQAELKVPTGLKQTAADRTGVKFSWDAVSGADGYYVAVSIDGETYSLLDKAVFSPSSTVLNLSAGQSVYVKVIAASADEETEKINMSDPSEALEVVTSPDAATMKVDCTERTLNTLTFTWNACAGATSYVVYDYSNKQVLATLPATTTSYKREGLVPGSNYGIVVAPVRTSASGFAASTNVSGLYDVYTNKSAPAKPSTSDFYVSIPSTSSKTASFLAVDTSRQAAGYEVEVYKVKGGKKVATLSATNGLSTNSMSFSKNTPYKYRVRYYVVNNGQNTYGEWSGYRYFYRQSVTGKKKWSTASKNAKVILKWSKVAGATGYTVSVSTSKNGKFKKVKTLGKKSKGFTITKIGKKKLQKNKSYYIKVEPKVKDGKTNIKNDAVVVYTAY